MQLSLRPLLPEIRLRFIWDNAYSCFDRLSTNGFFLSPNFSVRPERVEGRTLIEAMSSLKMQIGMSRRSLVRSQRRRTGCSRLQPF